MKLNQLDIFGQLFESFPFFQKYFRRSIQRESFLGAKTIQIPSIFAQWRETFFRQKKIFYVSLGLQSEKNSHSSNTKGELEHLTDIKSRGLLRYNQTPIHKALGVGHAFRNAFPFRQPFRINKYCGLRLGNLRATAPCLEFIPVSASVPGLTAQHVRNKIRL